MLAIPGKNKIVQMKKTTLANAILFLVPGLPMILQGQEVFETNSPK